MKESKYYLIYTYYSCKLYESTQTNFLICKLYHELAKVIFAINHNLKNYSFSQPSCFIYKMYHKSKNQSTICYTTQFGNF